MVCKSAVQLLLYDATMMCVVLCMSHIVRVHSHVPKSSEKKNLECVDATESQKVSPSC